MQKKTVTSKKHKEVKKTVVSPSFTMTKQDWDALVQQSLLFSAPLALMFLQELAAGKTLQEASGFVYAAVLQIAINFTKKYIQEK